jgi:cytochrome P450
MAIHPYQAKGLPFLGSVLDFARSPNGFMLKLVEQHGDVVNFKLANINAYVVAHPEAIQDILIRKKEKFVKSERSRDIMGRMLGQSLLVSIGEHHARQRHLVQPAFHATRIQNYADTMVDYTEKRLSTWQENSVRDIHHEMMLLTMEIVSKTLFGTDVAEDAMRVGKAMAFLQQVANQRFTNPLAGLVMRFTKLGKQSIEAGTTIHKVVMRFISERREQGTPDTGDLLSMLLLSTDENGERMNDKEVRDEALTLFAAGHETTSNAMTWTLYLLSQNPDVRQKLHNELDSVLAGRPTLADLKRMPYTQMVIKEAIRLYPPAWTLMARTALEAVEVGGYHLPQGTMVFIAPYAMHRNPRFWQDVNVFRPERFAPENEKQLHRYQYLPFGGGEHICIGNMFALMEAQLLLATICGCYELDMPDDKAIVESALVTLFPRDGLPMTIKHRQPMAVQNLETSPAS